MVYSACLSHYHLSSKDFKTGSQEETWSISDWLAPTAYSSCFLKEIKSTILGMVLPLTFWDFRYQFLVKKMPYSLTYGDIFIIEVLSFQTTLACVKLTYNWKVLGITYKIFPACYYQVVDFCLFWELNNSFLL